MWPPQSPDLNPIENLWDYVERKWEKVPSTTLKKLCRTIKVIWHSIPPEIVSNLVSSMPRRIEAVIKTKGGPTKYKVSEPGPIRAH